MHTGDVNEIKCVWKTFFLECKLPDIQLLAAAEKERGIVNRLSTGVFILIRLFILVFWKCEAWHQTVCLTFIFLLLMSGWSGMGHLTLWTPSFNTHCKFNLRVYTRAPCSMQHWTEQMFRCEIGFLESWLQQFFFLLCSHVYIFLCLAFY